MRKYVIPIIIAALLAISFFVGSLWGKRRAQSGFSTQCDTLYIETTKSGSTASILSSSFLEWERVSIPQFVGFTDTLKVPQVIVEKDTVRVYVPMSQTLFALNDGKVRVWASGYNVSIDRWEVDEVTREITKWPNRHRLFLSADGGIVTRNPHFAVMANYGYTTRWGFELNGGLGYDFVGRGVCANLSARINLYSWD